MQWLNPVPTPEWFPHALARAYEACVRQQFTGDAIYNAAIVFGISIARNEVELLVEEQKMRFNLDTGRLSPRSVKRLRRTLDSLHASWSKSLAIRPGRKSEAAEATLSGLRLFADGLLKEVA